MEQEYETLPYGRQGLVCVNVMAADDLVMQEARASAAMVLIPVSVNILALAPDWLTYWNQKNENVLWFYKLYPCIYVCGN